MNIRGLVRIRYGFRWLRSVAMMALLPALPAYGQATVPQNSAAQGLLQQAQRQNQTKSLLPRTRDQLRPSGSAAPNLGALPTETPCFSIEQVRFAGAHAQRLTWLSKDVQPVIGQCVGAQGLTRIADALDTHLIALGYATTRASFPPQNLASGVLIIHLDVGTVQSVRMHTPQGQPDHAWGTWRNAFPTGAGDILNIRDLEQGIEQMDRLSSQSVHTEIVPGVQPNSSVVVIERQSATLADRFHGGVTLDNSGNLLLGRPELSAALSFDNPLGLNDMLSVSANTNLENPDPAHRSQSAAMSYSIPWGYSLLSLSAQSLRFAQMVQGTTTQFLSSGSAHTQQARLDTTVWRTASSKFGMFATLAARQAHNYLDDVELVVQRRQTVSLDTGLTLTTLLPTGGRVSAQIGYRRGLASFGAQQDLPTAAEGGLTVRPRITTLSLSWDQPLRLGTAPWQYTLSLRGQTTPDTLVTEDQFIIGDRNSVRGFDGNTVLEAENGYALRNTLAHPVALLPGWNTAAYWAVDIGRVWGASAANLSGSRLAGTAIGLKGQHGHLQFDLALAAPLHEPSGFHSQRLNLYAGATVAF